MRASDVIIQVLTSFAGTLGLGILFNIRGNKLVFAAFGGAVAWGLFLSFNWFLESEILCYFIVSALMTVYAETLARVLKTPSTTFCISILLPLVPGSSLYYSVSYAVNGETGDFFAQAVHTLSLAAALAVGIILVTAFYRFLKSIKENK